MNLDAHAQHVGSCSRCHIDLTPRNTSKPWPQRCKPCVNEWYADRRARLRGES